MKIPEGYVCLQDVPGQVGACLNTVRKDVKEGRLKAYKIPRQKPILCKEEDVAQYREAYHKPHVRN